MAACFVLSRDSRCDVPRGYASLVSLLAALLDGQFEQPAQIAGLSVGVFHSKPARRASSAPQQPAGRCGSGKCVPSVWAEQIQLRTDGHDAGGVDVVVRHVVVPLDMVEVHGVRDTGYLIEVPEIAGKIRVVDDAPEIAFEMAMVDGVEPDQRDEESPIGFDTLSAEEVAVLAESRLQLIQRGKE